MKNGTRWIIAIVLLLGISGLATWAYLTWWQSKDSNTAKPDTTNTQQADMPSKAIQTFTSVKGVKIQLNNWPKDGVVQSPLTISGEVPGSWSFEGTFPIDLVYEGDIGLPGTTATLQGDWTTSEMVPFTATLTFDETTMKSDNVVVVLRNANPSGLPENDDSLTLPVHFAR